MATLKVKKLDPDAIIPRVEKRGDAGFDLFATVAVTIAPGERAQVNTGLAVEIPEGCVGLVWDKSGLSHKFGIKVLGGVIDSGYRGEILVGIANLGKESYVFEKGNKVAQMIVQKVESVDVVEVEELSPSERGEAGFGSTGK